LNPKTVQFQYDINRMDAVNLVATIHIDDYDTRFLEVLLYERGGAFDVSGSTATARFVTQSGFLLDDSVPCTVEGNAVTVRPKEIRAWSPSDPYLYEFVAESACDRIEGYFALREISVGKVGGYERILLNGEPIFLNALLDQGYYEDGIFLPLDEGQMEKDILFIKSLGFNTLRKHIKLEPMQFYHLCDRHGVIVMQDFINNSDYSFLRDTALPTVGMKSIPDGRLHRDATARAYFIETAEGIQRQLQNCPSVLYYTIFNEGWGQFCADDCYEYFKEKDTSRI
jgi:beta-galactosidase/beta-glucuronidase